MSQWMNQAVYYITQRIRAWEIWCPFFFLSLSLWSTLGQFHHFHILLKRTMILFFFFVKGSMMYKLRELYENQLCCLDFLRWQHSCSPHYKYSGRTYSAPSVFCKWSSWQKWHLRGTGIWFPRLIENMTGKHHKKCFLFSLQPKYLLCRPFWLNFV